MDLDKVNLISASNGIHELFQYVKIGQLNDHMLNIVKAEGRALDFHAHEDSDEMFLVIEGSMRLEFNNRSIDLEQGDFIIVPRGVMHRTVTRGPVTALLIEKSGTLNKGNTGGTYTDKV
ncbi:MAG TPA: cupin domain-containing protein [Spirochaetota bacterium]|nr:cupin domain-containing protein [Spirochaetota bacterium]HPV43487.1 cupin domain-containing protein [Spirochaetota bacterium]